MRATHYLWVWLAVAVSVVSLASAAALYGGNALLTVPAVLVAIVSGGSVLAAYVLSREWLVKIDIYPTEVLILEKESGTLSLVIRFPGFLMMSVESVRVGRDVGVSVTGIQLRRLRRDAVEVTLEFSARVGKHVLGPLELGIHFMGGFIRGIMIIEAYATVTVFPRSSRYLRAVLASRSRLPGITFSRRKGHGTQFLEVREYRPGDDYRRIDWKATARIGRLAIKEMEMESLETVFIAVAVPDTFFVGDDPAYDYLAYLVLEVSHELLRHGLKVRLIIITERGYYLSGHASGTAGIAEIYRTVSLVEWPTEPVYTSSVVRVAPWLISRAVSSICRGACTVVVLTSPTAETDAAALRRLRASLAKLGCRAVIYVTSPEIVRASFASLAVEDLMTLRASLAFLRMVSDESGVRFLLKLTPEKILNSLRYLMTTL